MNVRHLAARTANVGIDRPDPRPRGPSKPDLSTSSFAALLEQATAQDALPKLSAHAAERIEQRSISLTDAEHAALGDAINHLDAKGARDALLLRADAAFVVSVPNRTVVTAMAQDEMTDRAFTGIDSAMLL